MPALKFILSRSGTGVYRVEVPAVPGYIAEGATQKEALKLARRDMRRRTGQRGTLHLRSRKIIKQMPTYEVRVYHYDVPSKRSRKHQLLDRIQRMPDTQPDTIYISALAFLRTMLLIAWSSLRHPLMFTRIDILTGKCIHYS